MKSGYGAFPPNSSNTKIYHDLVIVLPSKEGCKKHVI